MAVCFMCENQIPSPITTGTIVKQSSVSVLLEVPTVATGITAAGLLAVKLSDKTTTGDLVQRNSFVVRR